MFISSLPAFSQSDKPLARETSEAKRIWEQMVERIGGRKNLHSIANLLLVDGDNPTNVQIKLYVFPNRLWQWDKGKIVYEYNHVSMTNLDLGVYLADPKPENYAKLQPVNGGSNYRESWLIDASVFLLETKWAQPTPVSVRREIVGKERLDVVRTQFFSFKEYNGWGLDFYVDPESLEVRRVAELNGNLKPYRIVYFDGFTTVDGITVPKRFTAYGPSAKIDSPKKSSYAPLEFTFNVEYDEDLFTRAPSVAAGIDAWKRKRKSTTPAD